MLRPGPTRRRLWYVGRAEWRGVVLAALCVRVGQFERLLFAVRRVHARLD